MLRSCVIGLALALVACGHAQTPGATRATDEDRAVVTEDKGAITGVVTDIATGKPLGMVDIHVRSQQDGPVDLSDASGNYRLPNLEPGSYDVVAEYAGKRSEANGVVVIANKQTKLNFEIDLRTIGSEPGAPIASADAESGTIEGTVRDGVAGELFPGAVVSASAPHLRDARMAIADENGYYRFPGLPSGTYVLSVYYHLVDKGNVELRRGNVEVTAGQVTQIDLELDTRSQK